MKVIAVTGTPCTGKTTVSKRLARLLKFEYFDLNCLKKLVQENGLVPFSQKFYHTQPLNSMEAKVQPKTGE